MNIERVPESFPSDAILAVVSGHQPKLCVVPSNGAYISGPSEQERYERWLICDDPAKQLIRVAHDEEAMRPEQMRDQILRRVRASVARKDWVSPGKLARLMQRPQTLLGR
ncbi:hypothetical protein [Paraburkholderia sediminicola]|uniref:hypothetical protein n=1 Tax=Paraburkholderia sediminicola TaxID=458836 RepID=UPI0038BDA576